MSKRHPIRLKAQRNATPFLEGEIVRRQDALARVCYLLRQDDPVHQPSEVLRLIGLFQFQPEELTEAGISYETVKALERQAGFL